jgi:hypothetical protein
MTGVADGSTRDCSSVVTCWVSRSRSSARRDCDRSGRKAQSPQLSRPASAVNRHTGLIPNNSKHGAAHGAMRDCFDLMEVLLLLLLIASNECAVIVHTYIPIYPRPR